MDCEISKVWRPSRPDLTVGLETIYHYLPLRLLIPEVTEERSSRSAPTLHLQNPLDQLISAPVFLCCLLDCLAGRIPYAESGDLGSIFPTQQCRTWDTYQVQAVAVTEQRSPLSVVHARRLVSQGARDGDLLSRREPVDLLAHNRTSSPYDSGISAR